MKSYFSSIIGMGVKKRSPTLCDIKLGRGTRNLQEVDTVNMVDVDLSGLEMMHTIIGFQKMLSKGMNFQPSRNCIQFHYNHWLHKIRMMIKAMAINTGICDVEPVSNFLLINEIQCGNTDGNINIEIYPELCNRRGVVINDDMWIISRVDFKTNQVILVGFDVDSGLTIHVSISK